MAPETEKYWPNPDSRKQLELLSHAIDFDNIDSQRKNLFNLFEYQARLAFEEAGREYGFLERQKVEEGFNLTTFIVGEEAVITYERLREMKEPSKSRLWYKTRLFKRALLRGSGGYITAMPNEGYSIALLQQSRMALIHEFQHLLDLIFKFSSMNSAESTKTTEARREYRSHNEFSKYYLPVSGLVAVLSIFGLVGQENPNTVLAQASMAPIILGLLSSVVNQVKGIQIELNYGKDPGEAFANKYKK